MAVVSTLNAVTPRRRRRQSVILVGKVVSLGGLLYECEHKFHIPFNVFDIMVHIMHTLFEVYESRPVCDTGGD